MSLPETPDETPQPLYALTRSNDLVVVGDGVTEDAYEVTYPGLTDGLSAMPVTVPASSLFFLPLGTTSVEATRLKLERAGMPLPPRPDEH